MEGTVVPDPTGESEGAAVISGMAKLSFVLNLVDKEPYCPFAPTAA